MTTKNFVPPSHVKPYESKWHTGQCLKAMEFERIRFQWFQSAIPAGCRIWRYLRGNRVNTVNTIKEQMLSVGCTRETCQLTPNTHYWWDEEEDTRSLRHLDPPTSMELHGGNPCCRSIHRPYWWRKAKKSSCGLIVEWVRLKKWEVAIFTFQHGRQ